MLMVTSSCVTYSNLDNSSSTQDSSFLSRLPSLADGKGRVIFYNEDNSIDESIEFPILINGVVATKLKSKLLSYRDVDPGTIKLANYFYQTDKLYASVVTLLYLPFAEDKLKGLSSRNINLKSGETKYIELSYRTKLLKHLIPGTQTTGSLQQVKYVRMRVIDAQQAIERIRNINNPIWGGI